ncbi:hypothetical protein [Nocardia terpenica]|uniref:Uncharacterized protein n=1 Tax=Nocardia terpenica TaxID=455432 RepID=A0A6G9ZDJ2_9NOCA|nr:hypothetical protein [Nocardia terpenica]QIS23689.1 hypothetical protein F6W96_40855 [Nocardia terpenica]
MESVDREALLDAGLNPDNPQVWADQRYVSDLLGRYGLRFGSWIHPITHLHRRSEGTGR